MTPTQLLLRVDALRHRLQWLAIGDVVRAACIAAACALLVCGIVRFAIGAPSAGVGVVATLLSAVGAAAWRWARRQPLRLARTDAALWAEQTVPELQYALITLAERDVHGGENRTERRLADFVERTAWEPIVRRVVAQRAARVVSQIALASGVGALSWALFPMRTAGADAPLGRTAATAAARAAVGRVAVTARVIAPAYSGRGAQNAAFGAMLSPLVGSVLRLDGASAAGAVDVSVLETSSTDSTPPRTLALTSRGDTWHGEVRVGTQPLAVRVRDAVGDRWLFLAPVVDSAPVVTLRLPATDTLVFDSTAVIRLAGDVHDDLGVRDMRVEYIISSGGGEQYTFKSGVLGERRGALGRTLTVSTTLDLGALGLKPGDLMHVRITAHDGNIVSGPSLGSSETRTIRLPRADERDSVAVDALPPTPVDTNALSQRQLLMLTERLVARLPRLPRTTIVSESQALGVTQSRLRKQVADIIFARLGDSPSGEHAHFAGDGHNHSADELTKLTTPDDVLKAADRATGGRNTMLDADGDETPIVAINKPLLEAYNAMWDASRALQGGEPRSALAPMRRALDAIQRARTAERFYLRGTPPAAVVDVAKIRLIGTDSAAFEERRALAALPATDRALSARVLHALRQLADADAGALDALRLARLDALAVQPSLASALGTLVARVEQRRDVTGDVLQVRRLAMAPWRAGAGSALWTGGAP
jgi:hypothetical protein